MKDCLIVLGGSNDQAGKLSLMSIERLSKAKELYLANPDNLEIILTGGFGEHFNQTDLPHTAYAKQFLQSQGIPEKVIVYEVPSSNTIEDAVFTEKLTSLSEYQTVLIVTSDFHLERAKLIFTKVFLQASLQFIGAIRHAEAADLEQLIAHEKAAIQRLCDSDFIFS